MPGRTLEIGGGSGNFKAFAPDAITSDILSRALARSWSATPSACRSRMRAFRNIVMVDVLHHIECPRAFFGEASGCCGRGGRLVFCEPAITPLSGVFYRLFHDEPVDMSADPLAPPATLDKDPYDSNQAIPTLLVGRFRAALARPPLVSSSTASIVSPSWPIRCRADSSRGACCLKPLQGRS